MYIAGPHLSIILPCTAGPRVSVPVAWHPLLTYRGLGNDWMMIGMTIGIVIGCYWDTYCGEGYVDP